MSWDRFVYDEFSKCKCGLGSVVRHMYEEDDDWNRSRGGCTGEEILCDECRKHYRIVHLQNYRHDGIIEYERIFLAPKNLHFPQPITERSFYFSHIEEEIVANYSFQDIRSAFDDMVANKYTTRLQLSVSRAIVSLYYRRHKKKSLSLVSAMLNQIIKKYDDYE